jgi:ppGpp synthetase/RelA/SpoT-type nucleotidyltranferase
MGTEIMQAIEELFPKELVDPMDFRDWCEPIRQDVFPGAVDLTSLLGKKLEDEETMKRSIEGAKRDLWELFGGEGDRLVKSVNSIRSKLARDLLGRKETQRQSLDDLTRMVLGFGDIGRIRIVVDYISDIAHLEEVLFGEPCRFLGKYACPKGIKDFIFDPNNRDGLKGHRAHQFSVRVPCENSDFGFEVQLMTRLQHAWDRRNHPLYEWQRESPDWQGDPAAAELAVNDFACAEALHLVDQQADRNWQAFLHKTNKRPL